MRNLITLALVLCVAPSWAAPVPPPERVTDKALVGTWKLEWGGFDFDAGYIIFSDDRTFVAKYYGHSPCVWVGTYSVSSGVLTLVGRTFRPETGDLGLPWLVEIDLSTAGPRVKGRDRDGTGYLFYGHET